ncbi:unnamed protein product [Rotaria socialis]|uniref:F-box domain-containing protein n=1 Tax=Rotaria socialis TaxID=392032 RepID=A0A817R0U1_9BILA|nr:unnamed protein product [Rotaria socialis]
MDIPNNNKLNILNLPNEILLFIFNKLKTIDALYSLVDVNERFDRLIFDSLHIRNLDTTSMVIKSYYNRNFSIDKNVLLRISEKMLPRIYHQLNELIVEQYSMEHILFAFNYPQLYSLSLVNFQEEILFECLTGDSILHHLLTQQITDLNVDVPYKPKSKVSESLSNIFALILSMSQRLINLNFCQLFPYRKTTISIYKLLSTSCVSSTLTKLKTSLSFYDRNNKEKLPELKYFSLTSMMFTSHYDDQIIPLLRRMINLKELTLFLAVLKSHSIYIDGIQLHDEILIHMPQLNKFTFSINTIILNENIKIDLPSNEDIQHSFIGKIYGKVGSYVHVRSEDNVVVSHVYSLPYQFQYFLHLANYFQDKSNLFRKVLEDLNEYLFSIQVHHYDV